MTCQCSLFPSLVPESDVLSTARETAARHKEVADLSRQVVVLAEAMSTISDTRPLKYGTDGNHACRRWPRCTHPGCEALRSASEIARAAMKEAFGG